MTDRSTPGAADEMTSTRAARHDLADWLALHDLDRALCRQLLAAAARQLGEDEPAAQIAGRPEETLDDQAAWLRVAAAFAAFFPAAKATVDDTFRNARRVAHPVSTATARHAFTLNDGANDYPIIGYSYAGTAADRIVMAHEFAHALQLVASKRRFIVPVVRETCAFIGELALLAHARETGDAAVEELRQAWSRDNRKYLGADRRELEAALDRPRTPYRYSWNYPVARLLAVALSARLSRKDLWAVCTGEVPMRGLLDRAGYLDVSSS